MHHLPPLAAEVIGHIGSFPVTNTLINAVLVSVLFFALAVALRGRLRAVPSGFQNVVEALLETVLGYMDQVTRDHQKSVRFLPLVGTLFLFILVSNLLGVFPGIGSVGRTVVEHGRSEFLPLFRPANTDYNLTLAMALLAVIASHVLGVVAIGFWKYADRFVKLGTLWRSLRKGGMGIFIGVAEFFVGLIEVVSEVAKVVSLSLRLFGNVFAGEALLTVMAGLIAWAVPLPFLLLETLVGVIQATVFAMLTLVYLTVATTTVVEADH
jgi:F-type H+-transporting ATPase subunit a